MAYKSLQEFISVLDKNDELIRIQEFVDPVLEIAEITDRFSKWQNGGKALLFENTGTGFPVLTNMMGSERRIALALGVGKIEDLVNELELLMNKFTTPRSGLFEQLSLLPDLSKLSGYFPSTGRGKAAVQEHVIMDPDLNSLPVLQTWPFDGGKFFTLPMVITKDPETGVRNTGMYRMQVMDKKTTGMHWHRHKTGANHYAKYKKKGKIMPVAVALGGDPALTYAATAPLPENLDEFLFAGYIRKKRVSLVKAKTQDILVPSDADIIIEGYVDPLEDKVLEGPFGDHTGFYSLEDYYPRFHVTAITHRRGAVFPATLVGIPPQEDAWIARATEKIFFLPIRKTIVPELTEMVLPDYGVAHNLAVVKIRKSYPGQAKKVMHALWGAGQMMFNKVLLVLDEEDDESNPANLLEKIEKIQPARDLVFSAGPLDVLDHATDYNGYGGKLGIDLTRKLPEESVFTSTAEKIPLVDKTEQCATIIDRYDYLSGSGKALISLITIEKDKSWSFAGFQNDILKNPGFSDNLVILICDKGVNPQSFYEFIWYSLNNIEINRDLLVLTSVEGTSLIIADGTSKHDGQRKWPNIVAMTPEIIHKIDSHWDQYGLGDFIPSPSLHYSELLVTYSSAIRTK